MPLTLEDALAHDNPGGNNAGDDGDDGTNTSWKAVPSGIQFDDGESDGGSDTEISLGGEDQIERHSVECNVHDNGEEYIDAGEMPSNDTPQNEFMQPTDGTITELPIDLTNVTYEQMVNAGKVPVGWTKEFYKRRRKKVGNHFVLSPHFTLATGAKVVPEIDEEGRHVREYKKVGTAFYHYGCNVRTGSKYAGKSALPANTDNRPFVPTPTPDVLHNKRPNACFKICACIVYLYLHLYMCLYDINVPVFFAAQNNTLLAVPVYMYLYLYPRL